MLIYATPVVHAALAYAARARRGCWIDPAAVHDHDGAATSTTNSTTIDHNDMSDSLDQTLPASATSTGPVAGASSPVKRACDACHRRKVKCVGDGSRPCKNCTLASLTCTYNAVPQKKGPKGSRAKVISELRQTQRQTQPAIGRSVFDVEAMHAASTLRTPGLVSLELITACVDYFFTHLYPTQPILHRVKVGETIGQMEVNVEAYCLVTSLCAYMLIQPNITLPPNAYEGVDVPVQSPQQLGHSLLQETIRVRRAHNYSEAPSVWSIITSFFLFGCNFCLDKQNTAWFYLREATTLAQIIGMHEESTYVGTDVIETSRRRRLYWLLFVTERAYALQQHKPLSLYATINLPSHEDGPTEAVELSGFLHLVRLFRPFDDTFVGLWNKARTGCTPDWLASLQQQLSDALPTYLESTETQAVDLRCSQQWLRTMVWQLSISHGFLSSGAAESAMSFQYPIEICRDLAAITSNCSLEAMEVHGIGLIEKLFDVACTLADVMACVPYEQYTFEFGPRDYLNQITNVISSLRGGRQRYLPLLITKIGETVPQLATSISRPGPGALRLGELYEDNQLLSNSATTSGQSTPFGTPPTSAVDCATYSFHDPGIVHPMTSGPTIITTGMDYGDMTATSTALFQNAYTTTSPIKFENAE